MASKPRSRYHQYAQSWVRDLIGLRCAAAIHREWKKKKKNYMILLQNYWDENEWKLGQESANKWGQKDLFDKVGQRVCD